MMTMTKTLRNPFSQKKKPRKKSILVHLLTFLVILLLGWFIWLFITVFFMDDESSSSDIIPTVPPVIAYAISLTSCNSESPSLVDGAATLAHSIHLNSIRRANNNKNNDKPKSNYDYKLYAFFHTSIFEKEHVTQNDINTNKCASILSKIGYEIKVVDIPVPLDEIQNEYLRSKLPSNGCCGEKEFIKLWSYTLVEHPFVVHLDLDTIVLQPLDELFNFALHGTPLSTKYYDDKRQYEAFVANKKDTDSQRDEERKKDIVMWNKEEKNAINNWSHINAFFTRDYNMRPAGKKPVGVQGGFLIVRPSLSVFAEFQSIIREGNFHQKKGWGGLGYQFYGAMTFQGIIPYYYDIIKPNTAIELNRCVYNAMADNPRDQKTVNNQVSGKCRDGRLDCEDCRERDIDEVKTAHFTLCQKPWECLPHDFDMLQHQLCRKLFSEWYKVRADLELSWQGKNIVDEEKANGDKPIVVGNGNFDGNQFRGFCNNSGRRGYIPMKLPE